jgi:hypothetical protein
VCYLKKIFKKNPEIFLLKNFSNDRDYIRLRSKRPRDAGTTFEESLRILLVVRPFGTHYPKTPRSPAIPKPFGFSRSSSLRDSLSQNRPSFPILCSSRTQEDFRLPIACISPDFISRRRNLNPGPIRREKSPHCTVFSEFPGFQVHQNFCSFSNRHIMAPFGKKSPFYRITPFPNLYSPGGYFLRRRVRWTLEKDAVLLLPQVRRLAAFSSSRPDGLSDVGDRRWIDGLWGNCRRVLCRYRRWDSSLGTCSPSPLFSDGDYLA